MIVRHAPNGAVDEGRVLIYLSDDPSSRDVGKLTLWRSRADHTGPVFTADDVGYIVITHNWQLTAGGVLTVDSGLPDHLALRRQARTRLEDDAKTRAQGMSPDERLAMYRVLYYVHDIRIDRSDAQLADILRARYPDPRRRK